jgi:hypothetical protein
MDSLIAAAGRALAAGDALTALKRVALRNDPPALALRGIAMAQLGELTRSRELLRRAARGFGSHEALAHARCVVAEAEVALALRDLADSPRTLVMAAAALDARADSANAAHARLLVVRRLLLLGRVDEAAAALAGLDPRSLSSPSLVTVAELATAEIALRRLHTRTARVALQRAHRAAEQGRVPALMAEVDAAQAALERPAARRRQAGSDVLLHLADVQALLESGALVVDACRHGLRSGNAWWSLGRRPLLFTLLCVLAEGWPADVDRATLIARAFRTQQGDDTHRARLRVEIGRLRALVAPVAQIRASARGFVLVPRGAEEVVVLHPPIVGEAASLLALLADGAAWSTSALALALGESQRNVQRALAALQAAGQVRSIGRARAQRWLSAPWAGFTTILLLPLSPPPA